MIQTGTAVFYFFYKSEHLKQSSCSATEERLSKSDHWFTHQKDSLSEKAMAPHSTTLAWKIPWTEEPGGLQSMESLRVGHDWVTSLSLFTFMHWRSKWQLTRVLALRIPGTGEPDGLPSMGSHRVGHNWSDLAAAAAKLGPDTICGWPYAGVYLVPVWDAPVNFS